MELECQLANILDNCEDMLLSKYYQQHGSSLEKSHFKRLLQGTTAESSKKYVNNTTHVLLFLATHTHMRTVYTCIHNSNIWATTYILEDVTIDYGFWFSKTKSPIVLLKLIPACVISQHNIPGWQTIRSYLIFYAHNFIAFDCGIVYNTLCKIHCIAIFSATIELI